MANFIIQPRIIFRVLSAIFCVSGLLYQSCQLISQYMSGKSVVNIEVKREINANLPAITICYPEIFSMEMIANFNQTYRDNYEKYKEMIDISIWNRTLYDKYKDNMTRLYSKFQYQNYLYQENYTFIKAIMNNMSLTFKNVYDQMTYDINGTKYHKYMEYPIIHLWLKGILDKKIGNFSVIKKIQFSNNSYDYNEDPVETVNFRKKAKCFTFFSFLNPDWIDMKIDLESIEISIRNHPYWFPPHLFTKLYLAIHSPKIIPELKVGLEFVEIQPNILYYVSYTKINIDLYYSQTESNCKDYGIDNYVKLRSDCITACMIRKSHDEKVEYATYRMSTLLRKEHFDNIEERQYNYTFHRVNDRLTEITQHCHKMCKPNCKYSYYLYDIRMIRDVYRKDSFQIYKQSYLAIEHNRLPDLFVRHIPETTFITFVGNFGGLLGMWLGINALIIFDNVYKLAKRVIKAIGKTDEHQTKIFIQRNINYNLRNTTELTQNNYLF